MIKARCVLCNRRLFDYDHLKDTVINIRCRDCGTHTTFIDGKATKNHKDTSKKVLESYQKRTKK